MTTPKRDPRLAELTRRWLSMSEEEWDEYNAQNAPIVAVYECEGRDPRLTRLTRKIMASRQAVQSAE
jgi:hypothetical protein